MKDDARENPAWLLIRSSIPLKLAFAKTADQFDLTYMQLLTLCLLDACKESPAMHCLTARLGCDASNVTGIVDKLVNQGFLERSESPQDRRAKVITLTDKGERTRQAAMFFFSKCDLFDALTPQEIDTLTHILGKLYPQE